MRPTERGLSLNLQRLKEATRTKASSREEEIGSPWTTRSSSWNFRPGEKDKPGSAISIGGNLLEEGVRAGGSPPGRWPTQEKRQLAQRRPAQEGAAPPSGGGGNDSPVG